MNLDFIDRHKRGFIISMIFVCTISMILTAGYRFRPTLLDNALGIVITPIQKGSTSLTKWFKKYFEPLDDVTILKEENDKLKEELDTLTAEVKRLRLIEAESQRLSALLEMKEKYSQYPMVGAEIIATDSTNWFESFIIDKGTKDGVEKDMVIMSSGGLVGRVIKAGYTFSEVISLINIGESSAVSVKCLRTEDIGIVKGDMTLMKDGLCRLDYVDLDAEIMEGDELVTSNLGRIYPPGLTVGYVKEVKTSTNGLSKYAIVEPATDFKHIENVLVIKENYDSFGGTTEE